MSSSSGKPRQEKPAPTPRELARLLWRALRPLTSCLLRLLGLLLFVSTILLMIDECGH